MVSLPPSRARSLGETQVTLMLEPGMKSTADMRYVPVLNTGGDDCAGYQNAPISQKFPVVMFHLAREVAPQFPW